MSESKYTPNRWITILQRVIDDIANGVVPQINPLCFVRDSIKTSAADRDRLAAENAELRQAGQDLYESILDDGSLGEYVEEAKLGWAMISLKHNTSSQPTADNESETE